MTSMNRIRLADEADAVTAFLADKAIPGIPADVYAANAAALGHTPCPQLSYRQTPDQLDPDPREAAVEAVLTAAGDTDDISFAITVISALRPDLSRADVLDHVHYLYELSEQTWRADMRGDRRISEHYADRYESALHDLAHTPEATR